MKKNTKIIHLLYSGLGGHSSVFFSLYDADRFNLFNHVPFFGGVEPLNPENLARCLKRSIRYRYFFKIKGFDFKFYIRILKALIEEKPDMVFLHGAGSILSAFFYKLIHPSVRIVIRDTQAAHLKKRSDWLFLFLAHIVCNKTIFLTEESWESLKRKLSFLFSPSKTTIIANGINTITYSNQPAKTNSHIINIGMQSRLQTIKDHPTLIKAFAKVVTLFPQFQIQLHIAGEGATMPQLKQMVIDLNLDTKVHFWGMLNEKELVNFMHNLDIYVHATLGETMSNSILQAMSCGLPIIASDVWGVNNMISDDVTGILYKSKDTEQLVEKIEGLIEKPMTAKKLGEAARAEVGNKYSSEIMYQRYKKIFREII